MANLSIKIEVEDDNEDKIMLENEILESEEDSNISKSSELVKIHQGSRKMDNIKIKNFRKDIKFKKGNPSNSIIKGVIHLFKNKFNRVNSKTLCMLSVPNVINIAEIITFCRSFDEKITNIRILSTSTPSIYLSIIDFISHESASRFLNKSKGKLISENRPQSICNIAFIESITYASTNKGGFRGTSDQIELPSCPICLERMDDTTEEILTVLCDHSFHTDCLLKWPDIRCPVCRYIQSPATTITAKCNDCDIIDDLWMCIICGNAGCGRYANKHAFHHFQQTSHTFSIKIGGFQVWDYAEDKYVHRLISAGLKPVEIQKDIQQDTYEIRLESLKLEYNHLLSFQLENQKNHYQKEIQQLKNNYQQQVKTLKEQHQKEIQSLRKEFNNKLKLHPKEDIKQLQEERTLNKYLTDNQKILNNKYNQLLQKYDSLKKQSDLQIVDLKQQVSDLCQHFEISSSLNNLSDELRHDIQNGDIIITENINKKK